ncbi:hypothetical protein BGX24_008146, partial [Mortierella sp. AD032]
MAKRYMSSDTAVSLITNPHKMSQGNAPSETEGTSSWASSHGGFSSYSASTSRTLLTCSSSHTLVMSCTSLLQPRTRIPWPPTIMHSTPIPSISSDSLALAHVFETELEAKNAESAMWRNTGPPISYIDPLTRTVVAASMITRPKSVPSKSVGGDP